MRFTFQGRLTDDGGQPLQAPQDVIVSVVSGGTLMSGGATVHVETISAVLPDANGVFSHVLGSDTNNLLSLTDLVTGDDVKFLELQVGGEVLLPRQLIVSVPFAFAARTVIGPDLYIDPGTGDIGVGTGTNTPAEQLEIAGAMVVGNSSNPAPEAGTIRWTGTAFEGFDGSEWVLLSPPVPRVEIAMVGVGNEGNPDDPVGGVGGVTYTYNIGKFEVTNDEYTEFLNAVDSSGSNALALYKASMNSDTLHGGISNNTSAVDGEKYEVKPGFSNKPVIYVSFYDAMRFCNWLHNGALTGEDTEGGAYTLLGGTPTPSNGTNVQRNAGAKFALPTEDEWHKAAHYEPGGDSDDYWFYPTRANSAPSASAPPGTAPAANYDQAVNTLTDVGAYSSTVGFFGTFDMAGNVREWVDRTTLSSRLLRGGSWRLGTNDLRSGSTFIASGDGDEVGFRVLSP
jgi:formylglycine-generating enzyme required for sulfatase activity